MKHEETRQSYIYKIESPTGKVYIGQTVDIASRFNAYRAGRLPSQRKLKASLQHHGFDAHKTSVLFSGELTKFGRDELERHFISVFGSFGSLKGMNLTPGGGTPAIRRGADNPNFGKPLPEHVRQAISKANKGKVRSEEFKQKCSLNNAMRNPENVHKMKDALKREDVREKMRQKALNNNTAWIASPPKPVEQLDMDGNVVATYLSAKHAHREGGFHARHVSAVCTGKRNQTGGFRWRYATDIH